MRILLTGASGYVGSTLVPRLAGEGHELVCLARDPERVRAAVLDAGGTAADPGRIVRGDVLTGEGLSDALEGVELAYYLVHSMERSADGSFPERERLGAETFAAAAGATGVGRIVYLGGPVPQTPRLSRHLASRLAVERALREAVPDSVSLRASIVIGARSRSFRFLVRLVERLPVITLPAWRDHRSRPVDERDVMEALVSAGRVRRAAGRALELAGPETLTYGEMIERIASLMLVRRPTVALRFNLTPVAARVAAALAGEDPELILPLMESLDGDLLPTGEDAAAVLGVRLHRFDSAVERALRRWEEREPLAAR